MRNRYKILFIFVGIILLIVSFGGLNFLNKIQQQKPIVVAKQVNQFSYKGEESKNALEILKNKAKVEQNLTGLVVSINDRMADATKKEYWSFYVNGKMAQVGPADYNTKNSDLIEWKVEKY
jgi:hypothetical protein